MFIDRVDEVRLLEKLYNEGTPKLVVLYGRRRVGKTALLNEFARRHKALYLVARQESEKEQLKKMSEEASAFFHDVFLKSNPFQNYDSLFIYLAEKQAPVLFDEFPFLVESNKAVPSILQEHWDKNFSKKPSFIVLCGSSIRMMESLLGYKSPIYGRRTEQIQLEPLKFEDASSFFPKASPEEKTINYAVLGGTPAYLLEFDQNKKLTENLLEKVLNKNKFLYQDVQYVIQQELNEPSTYYSIIKSIAKGNTKIGEIMNDTGIDKAKITKYASVLQKLHLIERRVPITDFKPEKSRRGVYVLKDNYFKFWFKFIFENNEYIEQGRQKKLIEEKINPELNAFVGKAFEEIALEWIKKQKPFNNFIFGRWWNKKEEIDIVGIDRLKSKILCGEVKWKKIIKKEAQEILYKIKRKAEQINLHGNYERQFIIIAKKAEIKEIDNCKIFDLRDIMKT
ncbi:MAG: ATP-binding protein [Candidatus Diapherotrites archaeon]